MRIVLFTGEGGAGTTTLAAATAARLARSGRKALVVSAGAAHSLGDALAVGLDAEPVEVDGLGGLSAAHLDPRGLLAGAWTGLRAHLRTLLAGAGVDDLVAEELTVLPGVEELLVLGEVRRLARTGPWDVVVVDGGPTAGALRLLALPDAVGRYLERLFPAHRRAVPGLVTGPAPRTERARAAAQRTAAALDVLADDLADLRALLTSPDTGVRLVLTPDRVVAAATRRARAALALHGVRVDGLVANRLLPRPEPAADGPAAAWLRERAAEQAAVLAGLDDLGVPLRTVAYRAAEPTGVAALLELGTALWGDGDPDDDAAGVLPAPGPAAPLLRVRRTAGDGRSVDAEFELTLHLPGVAAGALDLHRIGTDELAVTVAGARRLVALPAALRRCTATRARLDGDELRVAFRPDPALWLR